MRIRPKARLIQEALPDFGYLPFAASGADAAFAVQVRVQVPALAVPESARAWARGLGSGQVLALVRVPALA